MRARSSRSRPPREQTFVYSYKGGVGRSFAVANVAVVLAQWGARVLMVDWDIEAPGLNHYFAESFSSLPAGVLDFLDDCTRGKPQPWHAYATPIVLSDGTHGLHLNGHGRSEILCCRCQ
jgi:Mrp family chromosome partitioning ATPase